MKTCCLVFVCAGFSFFSKDAREFSSAGMTICGMRVSSKRNSTSRAGSLAIAAMNFLIFSAWSRVSISAAFELVVENTIFEPSRFTPHIMLK